MFEDQTRNEILKRILAQVDSNESVRPDTAVYLLASLFAEEEFSVLFPALDWTLKQVFPATQDEEYLEKDAATYKFERYQPTAAIIKGEFDLEMPLGTRFSKENSEVNYVVTENLGKEGDFFYSLLECESLGEIGNFYYGRLLPIEYIPKNEHAEIVELTRPGEEIEDVEEFRKRYQAFFQGKRYGGNLPDYFEWVCAYPGVGRAKILRCYDFFGVEHDGYVGIYFTDSLGRRPSDDLVDELQESIQPVDPDTGYPSRRTTGLGVAPIGHIAHVHPVKEVTVDVGVNLVYTEGNNFDTMKYRIEEKLEELFKHYRTEVWGDTYMTDKSKRPISNPVTVLRSDIEIAARSLTDVIDYRNVSLNGVTNNLKLNFNEIPILGEVTEIEGSSGGGACCPDCTMDGDCANCPRMQGINA